MSAARFEDRKSFVEKYFCSLSRLPLINDYISASIVMISTYLILQFAIQIAINFPVLDFRNIFIIRDVLAAIFLPPMYILFMNRLRRLPEEIKNDIALDEEKLNEFFDKEFDVILSWKGMAIAGALFSLVYFSLIAFYVWEKYYAVWFFYMRVIGVYGVFIVGAIVYQAIVLLKMFIFDVRELPLEISSIFNGLRSVSALGSLAATSWTLAVTIIMLPVFYLGFNPKSVIWYLFFYGTLYSLALVIFILIMYGFHVNMVKVKRDNINNLTRILNMSYTSIMSMSYLGTDKGNVGEFVPLVEIYEKIVNAKEWPFEISTLREVIFSYVLPLLTYMVSMVT